MFLIEFAFESTECTSYLPVMVMGCNCDKFAHVEGFFIVACL